MTATEIVIRRTGMSQVDAEFYVAMAEARVRAYLNLEDGADLSSYTFAIADIGVLYWQKDQSVSNLSKSYGYSTESFSEGGVSTSHGLMNGATVQSTYDTAINDILAGLDTNGAGAQVVVFL